MTKSCVAAGVVLTMSLGVGLVAEVRTGLDREAQAGSTAQASSGATKVHVEGCVFPKRALSSMQPVLVPAGSDEDYVLTDIKVIATSPGMSDVSGQTFALQEVVQDRLRELIGERVGVTGRVEESPLAAAACRLDSADQRHVPRQTRRAFLRLVRPRRQPAAVAAIVPAGTP